MLVFRDRLSVGNRKQGANMKSKRLIRLAVATGACMAAFAISASASVADPYVTLGDSLTAGGGTYAGKLYPELQTELGANEFLNRAVAGATSEGIRGSQLTTALADINAVTDTKAVTAGVGGNDALGGSCDSGYHPPSGCPFRANFSYILDQLQIALAADPGIEKFAVLAYYNPKNATPSEADFDNRLYGANGQVGLTDAGTDLGLNDVIYQEAAARDIPVADPSAAFKAEGQGLMSGDVIHPNDAGHKVIAQKFCDVLELVCAGLNPVPTCATDHSLCPPTCETDQSLCPPDPTCETDASLCPPDTKRPQTTITKGPVKVGKRSVKFIFRSSEKKSTFKCSLDGRKLSGCRSPKKLKRLKNGKHTFRVRATDAAGNIDKTPAKRRFRIRA